MREQPAMQCPNLDLLCCPPCGGTYEAAGAKGQTKHFSWLGRYLKNRVVLQALGCVGVLRDLAAVVPWDSLVQHVCLVGKV